MAKITGWNVVSKGVGPNGILELLVKIDYSNPPLYYYLKGTVNGQGWQTERIHDNQPPAIIAVPIPLMMKLKSGVVKVELHQYENGKDMLVGIKTISFGPAQPSKPQTQPQTQQQKSIVPLLLAGSILYEMVKR